MSTDRADERRGRAFIARRETEPALQLYGDTARRGDEYSFAIPQPPNPSPLIPQSARLLQRHRSRRTLPLAALRAAHPAHDVCELRVPPGERCQRARVTFANVAAVAREDQQVLPERIAEPIDVQVGHDADCT
jgi:hypothetical protein